MAAMSLAAAFEAAGFKGPQDELLGICIDAWTKWSKQEAASARRDYVRIRLCGTPAWAAFEGCPSTAGLIPMVLGYWLRRAENEIKQARQHAGTPAGGGHGRGDTHTRGAPADPSGDEPGSDGQAVGETQISVAVAPNHAGAGRRGEKAIGGMTSIADSPSAATMPWRMTEEQRRKHKETTAATTATIARLSKLDTFQINKRPIGDCTSTEANAWRSSRLRDARYVELLTSNLPAGRPIREYITAEEADALWKRACEETKDA